LSISSLESLALDSHAFVQYHGAGIEERYKINMKQIASGGYGKVYKAEDRLCKGRMVAIKKVLGMSEDTVDKFMKEAKIMQELDHPGICKIFEVYQDGSDLYFVLEFLEGGELFDRILSDKFTEKEVAEIVKQVACALKYAHANGVAHRDLKPENICFCDCSTKQVKVIDWGLSSDFMKGKMKSSVGSPTYSGPEVHSAQGEIVYTSACDLWSLGVMTYVMISGKPPFWGSPKNMQKKMQAEDYPMNNADWAPVSQNAKDFIRRLLKAQPNSRMTIDEAVAHSFLGNPAENKATHGDMKSVLSNMVSFSNAPRIFSLVMASATRQLNHSNSTMMRKVFDTLDTNHDGVLQVDELKTALVSVFGPSSPEVSQVQHIFNKLDLDGRGRLTYTEYCAAAMSEDERLQDQVLRLAFNAFHIKGGEGMISQEEIEQLLTYADANESLSKAVCESAAQEVIEAYDHNSDGGLDFDEFKCMMYAFAKPDVEHHASDPCCQASGSTSGPIATPSGGDEAADEGLLHASRKPVKRRSWARQLAEMIGR